ncbi:hypothetical protein DICPUDRAFT_32880 [Dictyostelium purpureum]|uniref:Dickkopf N-terminal cysteine-rich domain-containing protein n=1 Tax=Dictyostelium purpureum TaxID=5786 RepID=F0ZJX5_DICPU|nr:uncharacterized protein DICPUDRAFT_32880 [Dictyostelium purpureum]EGC35770.1 hypothetical protein DICPUDRAFT_32880 [Dictyostelium purpureum]|eukprot:XP_003287722.1 hypothetical protein DICPUDRAFT_32880 [Dictyostelium purpureum]
MIKCLCANSSFTFIYIVIFLFININNIYGVPSDLACSINLCSKIGEPCTYDPSSNSGLECYVEDFCFNNTCVEGIIEYGRCTTSRDCNIGYSCVPSHLNKDRCLDGRCVMGIGENENCNKSVDCQFGLSCVPNDEGVMNCVKAFYIDYGNSCNITIQCSHSLECIDNKCSTPLIGCFTDLQCAENEICVNGTCQVYILKENECFIFKSLSCKHQFKTCVLKSFNISSIGICVEDVIVGSPCITSKFSCDWGLGQYCKPLSLGSSVGNCTLSGENKFNICTSKNDCAYNEYCKCDPNSGVGYCVLRGTFIGRYCREATRVYLQCFLKSNCTQPFTANPYSCVRINCREEAQCYLTLCSEKLLPFTPCTQAKCNIPFFVEEKVPGLTIISVSSENFKIPKNSFIFYIIYIIYIILF